VPVGRVSARGLRNRRNGAVSTWCSVATWTWRWRRRPGNPWRTAAHAPPVHRFRV